VTGLEGLPRQVVKQDLAIENGRVVAYRTKVKVSFKYEGKG
jgi:flavin-binding protein dodecin